MANKKHINDVQPSTVAQHFTSIINSTELINYEEDIQIKFEDFPEWYDKKLFKAGQLYYRDNLMGMGAGTLAGLISVLSVPSILKILISTNKSSTPCTAFTRYLQTLIHIFSLYIFNCEDDKSRWQTSLNTIRWKHITSSKRALAGGVGGITQKDMVITQASFICYNFLNAEELGLTNTRENREGLNHFWRVVGHLLGISDRLNICRKTAAETTKLCEKIVSDVFAKNFKEEPSYFYEMTDALLSGFNAINITINHSATMKLCYELAGVKYPKKLGWYSWMNFKYNKTIFFLLRTPYLGFFIRKIYNYSLLLNYLLTAKYPVWAWLRFGMEESQINLYPKWK